MSSTDAKYVHISPPLKSQNPLMFVTTISLRIAVLALTLAASCLMLTSKQTAMVYGVQLHARYTYASAFTYFAVANLTALGFSVVSLFLVLVLGSKAVYPIYYFYIFLHDLIMTVLLMSACGAATTVGVIGLKGYNHIGWLAVCNHFDKFCVRAAASVAIGYAGVVFYLILTIISAYKSRH